MLRFYYNPSYKYTNRQIITLDDTQAHRDIDYANIDSPDTINGHIIYKLELGETLPTYILDLETSRRWFVSGITQLRTGKFQISLLRDIISESPEIWKNEQAYINSGKARDFIKYKTWGLPFTNTKIREQRLDINGKSSFFVFYVNEQVLSQSGVISEKDLNLDYSSIPGITNFDYAVDDLNEIPSFNIVNGGEVHVWQDATCRIDTDFIEWKKWDTYFIMVYKYQDDTLGLTNLTVKPTNNYLVYDNIYHGDLTSNKNNINTLTKTALRNYLDNHYLQNVGYVVSKSSYDDLEKYVDKIIFNNITRKVYTIRKQESKKVILETIPQGPYTNELYNTLKKLNYPISIDDTNDKPQLLQYGNWLRCGGTLSTCSYTLEELGTAETFSFNFKANQRKLPKSAVRCVNIVATDTILDSDIAQSLMLAQTNPAMTEETANVGRILDIQYLPFSIATETNENIKINNKPMIAQFLDNDDFQYAIDLPDLENINKETDTIKIVSPSRASQFLFRPYNNDGNMIFNVEITIKPYTSIIYIRPSTQGLLLTDWDDKDCLVIQEDFSLTNITSSWTNYIYSNRNFQSIFEREIQGRAFQRDWERKIEQAQAKSDEWTARNISSQKARAYTGNLPIISDIAGAIGTAWQDSAYMQAAQLDREYNEALYQEGISLARDNFQMQLENIQSQPNIPSKITTIDVKMLDGVYLEYYSTNETELQAIENFYYYNGERIDAYGIFANYWGWFVRGKIIISNNYTQPEIDELNRRLNMGIFTGESYD